MATAIVVAALAVYLNAQGLLPLPWQTPPDDAPTAGGPNMTAVFAANADKAEARRHALMAAEFFSGLARGIDFDAGLNPPRLKTAGDVEDLRFLWRQHFTRGWSFDSKYPDFGNVIGEYIDKTIGEDGGASFDESARVKWKQAYLAIEAECRAAARKNTSLLPW